MKVPHVEEDKLYNEVLSLLKIFDLIICSMEGLLDNIIEKISSKLVCWEFESFFGSLNKVLIRSERWFLMPGGGGGWVTKPKGYLILRLLWKSGQ